MKNTYHYRHFLICSKLANDIMGHQPQNFAQLMVEENLGRFMNSQMTFYFKQIDQTLSDILGNDAEMMWEELDMDELAELSVEQIQKDYEKYVDGKLEINEAEV